MGKRGAPLGNTNGAKGKEWLSALQWALKKYETEEVKRTDSLLNTVKRGQALRAIALRVVGEAIEGKEHAIREISERIDGKVSAGETSTVRVLVVRNFGLPAPVPVGVGQALPPLSLPAVQDAEPLEV